MVGRVLASLRRLASQKYQTEQGPWMIVDPQTLARRRHGVKWPDKLYAGCQCQV